MAKVGWFPAAPVAPLLGISEAGGISELAKQLPSGNSVLPKALPCPRPLAPRGLGLQVQGALAPQSEKARNP